jgi:hypothetical protein
MMKTTLFSLCFLLGLFCTAQKSPDKSAKPTIENLPQSTILFKSPERGVPVSSQVLFLGQPFCSSNGTTFLNARMPPDYATTSILGISSNGEMHQYPLQNAPGLKNMQIRSMDAVDSDVFLLIAAQKTDVMSPPIQPGSRNLQYFLLHLTPDKTTPDVIRLSIPFDPMRAAFLGEDQFIVLGMDLISRMPVMAIVDDSGDVARFFDTQSLFGEPDHLAQNASTQIKSQAASLPDDWAQLTFVLSTAQFVHQGTSLVFLLPSRKNEIVLFRQNGSLMIRHLHLPEGSEVNSLIPSDKYLVARASNGKPGEKAVLFKIDIESGDILQVIHAPQLPIENITCVHEDKYSAIHWAGQKGKEQMYLMTGTE